MKRWVLITGASQGIGLEFARIFAAEGWDVVLLARDQARLEEIARELRKHHAVQARVLAKDLSRITAAQEIFDELEAAKVPIAALVNNAGFGARGAFAEVALQKHLDLAQVNITSLVQLTHLFARPMLARHEGWILNVASTAAFQPGPFMAMYYASKAFVYSFSCALAQELKGSGVSVTALCPGMTHSEFHERAGMRRKGYPMMATDKVAKIGYRAMMARKPVVVAGLMNKIMANVAKSLPTRLVTPIAEKVNR